MNKFLGLSLLAIMFATSVGCQNGILARWRQARNRGAQCSQCATPATTPAYSVPTYQQPQTYTIPNYSYSTPTVSSPTVFSSPTTLSSDCNCGSSNVVNSIPMEGTVVAPTEGSVINSYPSYGGFPVESMGSGFGSPPPGPVEYGGN